ncbi:MAG: transcriptional regulator [Omnitrophica WOR_2 bacterium RIFCSPLOWO2_12_FULL_51_24]|nr:MAG: transcriptional regulator [Omnitrophica WOR_2 bacterium RIFCSPHIGHO2_01_FULL_49_10]OGX35473.1 MAG: transcriptional regulator [Omnitrophica WOR_2 bacterium RIFCSPLOWO2_02_FULL_50_19]OGX43217.1 MAG: transcriptional regulator [Omnitrophica WOR_2 bacterium RIFCSPLOWO2_12_FULL_51_24]
MKKIEAVVRVEKLDEITDTLEKFGYPGIMVTRIEGHGRQKGLSEQFRGREYKVNFLPKIKLEIVTKDADVEKIVKAILSIARTGEIGDGKIFIYPVEDVIRIRTGEKGESAV